MSQPQAFAFPLKRVKALLAKARTAARPTETEIDDRFSIYFRNAMSLLAVFSPPLQLKPGWTLITQQYGDGVNDASFTWAIPSNGPQPDPFLTCWPHEPTPPEGAVEPMTVIDGNHSPWSYLWASLLARELSELGAVWHGCDWSTHELYGGAPLSGDWTFSAPRPGSYSPTVTLTPEGPTVTFFTQTGLGVNRIVRHTDMYTVDAGYRFQLREKAVAHAPGGFMF